MCICTYACIIIRSRIRTFVARGRLLTERYIKIRHMDGSVNNRELHALFT